MFSVVNYKSTTHQTVNNRGIHCVCGLSHLLSWSRPSGGVSPTMISTDDFCLQIWEWVASITQYLRCGSLKNIYEMFGNARVYT